MTSTEIRRQFIAFFESKGHVFVPSSPVVPQDDPTLMFTNAGMNQFKPIFLGSERAAQPRVANTQKCIRAGGKHNDLDDVGKDTYHHTFFEMLGNWSFGDYFKKEAISWAWELLTKVWGIDKRRLHATYFEGDPGEGLEPDSEAASLWRETTDIDPAHIHPGNKKDNFWEMGETGPCGPCSEIHIDLTADLSGGALVNAGDARVMEIWNLVFIQFNRGGDGKLTPLPARHVDTGMGFERLCAVLQGMERGALGKVSNYDTDVFTPVFEAIQRRTGAAAYEGTLPGMANEGNAETSKRRNAEMPGGGTKARSHEGTEGGDRSTIDHRQSAIMTDVSYRVIADHLRCLVFALTDGALPSNEGRGYVLRRILRRAVRYGRQYLHMHEPFLCDLVGTVVEHMGDAFPELRESRGYGVKNAERVAGILRDEEESFGRTFDRGLRLYREEAEFARKRHHGRIGGEAAFKLHDTYGFTIDLTELMAEEDGLTIDIGEYERLMEKARERARKGSELLQQFDFTFPEDYAAIVGRTDDARKYDTSVLDAKCRLVIAFSAAGIPPLFTGDNGGSIGVAQGGYAGLIFDRTCFYAEQGGQVGDTGKIKTETGIFVVESIKRSANAVIHAGYVEYGEIRQDQQFSLQVDWNTRFPTMQNHTATHVLNWALREVLELAGRGKVDQKGSLVDPEKTRFDFSHHAPLTDEELQRIERLCAEQIAAGLPVYAAVREEEYVDQRQAREINTLRAVFGEKYPERVRVVSIGAAIEEMLRDPKNPKWMQYAVEFCGGTHVKNTAEIEAFTLVGEEGVAKGVRRVVGVSGEAAKVAMALGDELLQSIGEIGNFMSGTPSTAQGPRGLKPAARQDMSDQLAAVQQRLAEAQIPILVRRRIQHLLAELQKEAKKQDKQAAADAGGAVVERVAALLAEGAVIGGAAVVVGEVPPAPTDALRGAIDWVRNKSERSAVLLAFADDNKVTLLAGMSKAVVERGVKAGDLIKEIAPLVGGKGGGRPDMAQGGGTDAAGLTAALEAARKWLAARLG